MNTLLAAGALSFAAGAASAATYTIEDFGEKKPDDPYVSQGYIYDPANGVNGQCYDKETWCLKEAGTQDFLTTIDTTPEDNVLFSLLGFYVNLDGVGSQEGEGDDAIVNYLRITDNTDEGDVLTLGLNIDYKNDTDYNSLVSIFTVEETPEEVSFLDKRSEGFWVIIESGFTDVTKLTFEALGSANVRIDCMALAQGGDHGFEGVSSISTCAPSMPPPPEIPLPAAGWLLIGGLGGLAAMKRRKS
ncbi:VPLPA-CTERM sorting domain-containing protein [Kangsaoukella pontilimi]|uniref:VPLPA-CTERM sorting domain-containing protein n=1 Tax=Kangsaoukella pontilimi TaxID=2691042 RepID=UPI001D0AEFA3|nr:VPLPA-CTERM sorting domain-containing protein [Kangsaoukella pontilimi]